MKYTENDLLNIVAICEQEEPSTLSLPDNLAKRCRKALAYRDISIRITKHEKDFLQSIYDKDMDPEGKETLERILN